MWLEWGLVLIWDERVNLKTRLGWGFGVDLDEQVLLFSSVLLGKKCSCFVLMYLQVLSSVSFSLNRIPNRSLFSWPTPRFSFCEGLTFKKLNYRNQVAGRDPTPSHC
jgi:hypothetical protein